MTDEKRTDEKRTDENISQIIIPKPNSISPPHKTFHRNVFRNKQGICHKCNRFKTIKFGISEHIVYTFDNIMVFTGYSQYSFGVMSPIHTYKGACSLIKYSKLVCNYLTGRIGSYSSFRILLSSNINLDGTKDHIHSWITINDDNAKKWYDRTYQTHNGKHISLTFNKGTAKPTKPYKNDHVYVVNREEQEIFKNTNDIQTFFNQINDGFDENNSFYIFIQYKTDMDYFANMIISR